MALRFSGVPVYREGLRFMIPSGSWSVAEACSGVRYVIASSMLGTLFACLTYRTLRRRLVFIGVSLIVPIFANWLRAYLIVMLGHLSGNTLAVGVDHLIYGWLFFGVIILIMFRIGTRWQEEAGPKSAGEPEVSRTGIGAHRRGLSTAFLASAVLAALWPLLWRHVERNTLPELTRLEAPAAPAGWVGSERNLPDWAPRFTTASASLRRGYAKIGESGRNVGLFLAYYRNQDENRKLVSSGNALVKGSDHDWEETETGTAAALVQGMPLRVRTSELLSAAGERLFVWQWYWINGRWTANDYLAKAYTALSRLTGEGDDSAVVIVYTAGGEGSDPDAILRDFTAAASPVLWNALQETRHGHE
jgi:EpsI family protein